MKSYLLLNVTLHAAATSFDQMKRDYVKYFPDKFMHNAVNEKIIQQHEADKLKQIEADIKRQRQKRRKRLQRFIKNYMKKSGK